MNQPMQPNAPASPRELTWWNRINLLLVAVFLGLGFLVRSQALAGILIGLLGATQAGFGWMLLTNRNRFADRLGEYAAGRPLLLGGLSGRAGLNRVQGGALVVFGIVLIAIGIWLLVS
jgi:hypothetical protein